MNETQIEAINALSALVHQRNVDAGWWTCPRSGEDLRGYKYPDNHLAYANRDVIALIGLAITELSEAIEGVRKNCMDDKLPNRKMAEVEIADAFIRLFDIAGAHGFDLGNAMAEKLAFNAVREDHKMENRKNGGKAA